MLSACLNQFERSLFFRPHPKLASSNNEVHLLSPIPSTPLSTPFTFLTWNSLGPGVMISPAGGICTQRRARAYCCNLGPQEWGWGQGGRGCGESEAESSVLVTRGRGNTGHRRWGKHPRQDNWEQLADNRFKVVSQYWRVFQDKGLPVLQPGQFWKTWTVDYLNITHYIAEFRVPDTPVVCRGHWNYISPSLSNLNTKQFTDLSPSLLSLFPSPRPPHTYTVL